MIVKEFSIGWIWMASIGPVSGMLSLSIITYLHLGIILAVFLASRGYSAYHYFSTQLDCDRIHMLGNFKSWESQ